MKTAVCVVGILWAALLPAASAQSTVDAKPPQKDVVVRRSGQPLPCEQLLPRSELTAVLGPSDQLSDVLAPRPDFSSCAWKRPADDEPVSLQVSGAGEFQDGGETMKSSAVVTIATFPSAAGAQIAKGILDEEGIESMIRSDDAGGMYPAIGGAELLVRSEDSVRADQALRRRHRREA